MKIVFDIARLVPRFLLRDKNGYAIAKAIEKAFQYAQNAAEEGLKTLHDVESMPEWRLDELAWEYNIPYDYKADAETKRKWISDAYELSQVWGTPDGIVRYVQAYFSDVTLQEAASYGGDPFHFRMDISGEWNEAKQAWVVKAVETVKNARSVLDAMRFRLPDVESDWQLYAGVGLYESATLSFPPTEQPDLDAETYLTDETGGILMDEGSAALTDEA